MANLFDRAIGYVAPMAALRRIQARRALQIAMNYSAVDGARNDRYRWRREGGRSADAVGGVRGELAELTREQIRNTPLARQGQRVIANNVIGDGIIPKAMAPTKALRKELLQFTEEHLDTVAIDADGRQNLYGLQRLALDAVVADGEVLVRRRRRLRSDGFPLPFQIQLLEADFINSWIEGRQPNGNICIQGIEYDLIGRRVAYHLYREHPGGTGDRFNLETVRVMANDVLHIFHQERPGQQRGVSWYAPVLERLKHLDDYDDAELVRQKIAACFVAFRTTNDITIPGEVIDGAPAEVIEDDLESLSPGRVERLPQGEEVSFAVPPQSNGYPEFTKTVHRLVAAGLGITYESLTGDLKGVNFSSGRMGRMEMDRNVSSWQNLMMIPQFCQPFSRWLYEAYIQQTGRLDVQGISYSWVPPTRMLIDPKGEIQAARDEVRAGFSSRQSKIRQFGYDPERVVEEIVQDNGTADKAKLVFDSDPRHTSANGVLQSTTEAPALPPPTKDKPDGQE